MFDVLKRLSGHDLAAALVADAETQGLSGSIVDTAIVDETDLRDLPEPVRRYMRFMRVVGRPRDASFRTRFNGRFRMRPGQRFMPVEAWQYNTRSPVARLFHMRLDFAGVVPMVGRDAYVDGHGHMLGKLGVLTVADGRGEEFDIGELTTWLNDAIILCPSMLLDAATTFSAVDASAFDVTFTDAGRTVSARVFLDDRGAPRDFSTTDRFAAVPGGPVRAEWTTPIDGWDTTGDRPVPGAGAATWHLPDGPFTYIDGRFAKHTLEYNVDLTAQAKNSVPAQYAAPNIARDAIEVVRALPTMLTSPAFRSRHMRWGATDDEVVGPMPGDDILSLSHFTATRALTIAAAADEIWPLLTQVGFGRAGFYSYDMLDNLGRPSAVAPLPEWQDLDVGDVVAPMTNPPTPGTSFVLHSFERDQWMVWSKPDSTWTWRLTPLGPGRTRLVTRIKQRYRMDAATVLTIVLCEFGDFTMMRKMLLGIKARAELLHRTATSPTHG